MADRGKSLHAADACRHAIQACCLIAIGFSAAGAIQHSACHVESVTVNNNDNRNNNNNDHNTDNNNNESSTSNLDGDHKSNDDDNQ